MINTCTRTIIAAGALSTYGNPVARILTRGFFGAQNMALRVLNGILWRFGRAKAARITEIVRLPIILPIPYVDRRATISRAIRTC